MKIHKFSNIFPIMNDKEFKELKKDIEEKGLLEPIVLFEEKILDGRNRFKACKELNIKPKFKKYDGDNALGYVISVNLKRRHLNESQKSLVALKYKPLFEEEAKKRQQLRKGKQAGATVELIPPLEEGKARDKLGEVFGVSGRYIDMAEEIQEKKPEIVEEILNGKKKVASVIRDIKLEEQENQIEKLEKEKKIEGIYDIIVIDPPWKYGTKYDDKKRRIASPYPERDLDYLMNIKIPASDNCILFLWTTHKFIHEAFHLLDSWGFKYSESIIVWDKEKMGVGVKIRKQCEFCLIGIKGNPPWRAKDIRDIIREKRTKHSIKPESFYQMIEKNFKKFKRKLDYFARKKRKDWDVYGDEVI